MDACHAFHAKMVKTPMEAIWLEWLDFSQKNQPTNQPTNQTGCLAAQMQASFEKGV